MSADKNPYFESIADAAHYLQENRELIEAYLDNEAREAYHRQREKLIQEQDARLAELDRAIQENNRAIQEKAARIAELDRAIQENDRAIQEKDARIAELKKTLAEKQKL